MANNPKTTELIKYLSLWIEDWHTDTLSLIAAMNRLPRSVNSMASRPTSGIPDPPPPPVMSASPDDCEWCDDYFQTIAYNNYVTALGVLHLSPDPKGHDLAGSLGYDDVNSIDATNEWMRLTCGLFKSMIRFYPITSLPGPLPAAPTLGPGDTEARAWSDLKTALEKQAREVKAAVDIHFAGKAMALPSPGKAAAPTRNQSILSIERSAHQVFMDYCRIANHLPDHFPPPGPGYRPSKMK